MTAWRIWAWPVCLGVLMASGLASALVADGWGDRWSWLALGLPVAAMVVFGLRRTPATRRTRPLSPAATSSDFPDTPR